MVIATTDVEPDVGTRLLLVCASTAKGIDAGLGITSIGLRQGAVLRDGDSSVPIYGELLTFVDSGDEIASITTDSGIAGLRIDSDVSTVLRLGYDLFEEVRFLLSTGQPIEYAHVPTFSTIHIQMLRARGYLAPESPFWKSLRLLYITGLSCV